MKNGFNTDSKWIIPKQNTVRIIAEWEKVAILRWKFGLLTTVEVSPIRGDRNYQYLSSTPEFCLTK